MTYTVGSPWVIEPPREGEAPEGQREHVQALNREHARAKMREWLDAKRRKVEEEIAWYETRLSEGCDFCIGLPFSGYNLKSGCGALYGLIEDHKTDEAKCPECGRVLAYWA